MTTAMTESDAVVTETAWAKINLTLHVTGRRPAGVAAAGYHELDSLIVFAGIGDELTFSPAEDLSLELAGPFASALEPCADNLVLSSARRLAELAGIAPRAAIRLTKRLPVAAGIGGGSADAAACLRGLSRLWRIAPDSAALERLALELGADVPVCLHGRACIVSGIGDVMEPAPPLPPAWLVLVNPRRPLATPAVFGARRGPFSRPDRWDRAPAGVGDLAARLAGARNDLEQAACELVPEIGTVLSALKETPGCLLARMSGSGATCFGLYETAAAAGGAAAMVRARRDAWWVEPAPMILDASAWAGRET